MKATFLFFSLLIFHFSNGQTILLEDPIGINRIKESLDLLRYYEPEIYEAITQHCFIEKNNDPDPAISSNAFDREDIKLWILIGETVLYNRSKYRLAGTIYHESLHLLSDIIREREGKYTQTPEEIKEEEIYVYKKTKELLVKIGAPLQEIKNYNWAMLQVQNQNY